MAEKEVARMDTDSQVTEIIGRNWLVNELLKAGLEVAAPLRDHGIDLFAYFDLNADAHGQPSHTAHFAARPLQLKAVNGERFMLDRKYEKFPDLLLVYVWHLKEPARTIAYALSYSQALAIAESLGWTATEAWKQHGVDNMSVPSKELVRLLEPYRATNDRWPQLIRPAPTAT